MFPPFSTHIPYIAVWLPRVTPNPHGRRRVAMRDASLHDVVTAAAAPVPKKALKFGGKPWGILRFFEGFKGLDCGGQNSNEGLDQLKSMKTVSKCVFLKVADPTLSVLSSQVLHSRWGSQRFWATPKLHLKAPQHGSCNRRNGTHGSTWLQVL